MSYSIDRLVIKKISFLRKNLNIIFKFYLILYWMAKLFKNIQNAVVRIIHT